MLTGEERALFAGAKEAYDTMAKVPCTKCAYCMPCPFGVDIPGVFDAYNRSAFSQEEGEARYAALEGKAELCREMCIRDRRMPVGCIDTKQGSNPRLAGYKKNTHGQMCIRDRDRSVRCPPPGR